MMDKLPGFLIVGAAKSGTTTLYDFLRKHPDICMPSVKEPNFFSGIGDRGNVTAQADYVALFRPCGDRLAGEASVSYLPFYAISIPRIKALLGDPAIVMVLRNPVDRAFSHYTYFRQLGLEHRALDEVLSPDYRVVNDPWGGHMNPYIEPGMYSAQVAAYLEAFSRVRVFLFDELKDSQSLGKALYRFLGVVANDVPPLQVRNVSGAPKFHWVRPLLANRALMHGVVRYLPYSIKQPLRKLLLRKPALDDRDRRKLLGIYLEDIQRLSQVLDRDLSQWCK